MKRSALIAVVFCLSLCASADVIRLKNGVSINADRATIKGDTVEYVIGSTTYYLPEQAVDRIEPSASFGIQVGAGTPASRSSTGTTSGPSGVAPSRPAVTPPPIFSFESPESRSLASRILNMGRVDERILFAIEAEGNRMKTAAAYWAASRHEYKSESRNLNAATSYARRALDFAPGNVVLLCWYSTLLIENGQNDEAISQAKRAIQIATKFADAHAILGFAYYNANRLGEAIQSWKKAISIEPDTTLNRYLAKAEREFAVEESFNERETAHFTVRLQGRRPGVGLTTELLRTLERQHTELGRDLGFVPSSSITVILYTEQEFFDVTQAPNWVDALNDGKLRVSVKDLSGVNAELEHVLKHELIHTFLHEMTRGRCPGWIQEGMAQMLEPRDSSTYGSRLAQLFNEGKHAPLAALEGSFSRLTAGQAALAYAESLSAVEYLRSNYGMSGVQRILTSIAEGEEPEEAVRSVTRSGYSQLEKEIGVYLSQKYGNQGQ
jgi:tetratricopeptide (TPR) repeat protein